MIGAAGVDDSSGESNTCKECSSRQSAMELLTPRELSQTTEGRLLTTTLRVTIPNPSDTRGDPVVEQTVQKLIETAGRFVANRSAPGSEVTAPYGTIDDTGRSSYQLKTLKYQTGKYERCR